MNRFQIILILWLGLIVSVSAQSTQNGDILLNSQSQVDNFPIANPGYTVIEGELRIYGELAPPNDRITDLTPLSQITAVNGGLKIYYCPELNSLAGLGNLVTVGGDVELYHIGIENLEGLFTLQTVEGRFWLEDNPSLQSFSGLGTLTNIEQDLIMALNPQLTDLSGLSGIENLGGNLEIYENPVFRSLTGLAPHVLLGGDVYVYNNPHLSDLHGLETVEGIGGSLVIAFNPSLHNLIPLAQLKTIGDDLEIYCNDSLNSLAGLENLTFIPGSVTLACLDQLANLKGLNAISSIDGNLSVQTNRRLKNFSGLNALTSIGGQISIWNNEQLNSLSGLESLKTTGGFLKIYDNPVLGSLSGIDHIDHEAITYLYLVDNDSLSYCEVESICRFFYNPEGTVVIHGNKEGCNSGPEISAACVGLYPDPIEVPDDYILYPNPAGTSVTIITKDDKVLTDLRIFDTYGKLVLTVDQPDTEINISPLSTGVYLLKFDIDGVTFTDQLVVR